MSKLRKLFSKKEWKECCGSFCKTCEIACTYKDKYGKHEGLRKHLKDHKKYN
jgi:hypothetical protein